MGLWFTLPIVFPLSSSLENKRTAPVASVSWNALAYKAGLSRPSMLNHQHASSILRAILRFCSLEPGAAVSVRESDTCVIARG